MPRVALVPPALRLLLLACFGALNFSAMGCMSARAFVPAEHVTALSPQGRKLAAEYTVRESSRLVAEVKVWSEGATRNSSDEDDDVTIVQVGFEVHNHTEGVVRLDSKQLSLDEVKVNDTTLGRVPLLRLSGPAEIRPGEERELLAVFRLPSDVWPSELRGYRVVWTLSNGGVYRQKTPFVLARSRYDDNIGPYYYPSFYFGVYPSWYYPYPYSYPYFPPRYRLGPGYRYRRYR